MDKKGPTSFPLGLITPMVAVSRRSQKFPVPAKKNPARPINAEPRMSIRRLPIRSARVVIPREITVSPRRVRVSSRPILASLKPTWDR